MQQSPGVYLKSPAKVTLANPTLTHQNAPAGGQEGNEKKNAMAEKGARLGRHLRMQQENTFGFPFLLCIHTQAVLVKACLLSAKMQIASGGHP